MLSVLPSIGASTTLEIARSIAIAELNCANRLFGKSRCPSDADSVKYDEEQAARSKKLIALQLKALIARDLFDTGAYFVVMNPSDPTFIKAMEIIGDDQQYNSLLGRKPDEGDAPQPE